MLVYNPLKRINLYEAMAHPLFNELRQKDLMLPNGNCVCDLFGFTSKEKEAMGIEKREILIPEWYDPKTSPSFHSQEGI